MAIRKDVNDMLNNLKQEEPPKEEKHSKSKFDDMSVDDLLTALNDEKENETPRKAPIRELKRIPSSKSKGQPKTDNNTSSEKNGKKKNSSNPKNSDDSMPKRKRIVIGELPDYEAIRQQEIQKDTKEETKKEKTSKSAESEKKDNSKSDKDNSKKGFFSRVKDLMYVSADDDAETEEETDKKSEVSDDENKGSFTVEEIKESTDSIVASIEEAISAITDTELVKEEKSDVPEKENKPKENKSESVSKNSKKNNNKTKQNGNQKKKTENSNSKSETKPETKNEKQEENKEEKNPETKTEKAENSEEKKSEIKNENTVDSGEKKEPTKNPQQSGSKKKKKNGNKQTKDSQKPVKSSESIIEDIKKEAENTVSEIEKNKASENKEQENADTSVEETKQVSDEQEKNTDTEQVTDEIIVRISENKENVGSAEKFKKGRYAIPALLCIVLAIVGVIAIVSTLISNIGGKDDFEKAVYPAVIMNINPFDSPSELTSDQIISAAIWSVVIDNKKLSEYNERMGAVNIPASDVEKFAVELFGEDIPELNHTTVGSAESKFYYNKEAESYNVPIKPNTFTYLPEVTFVSKRDGKYIVDVNYIEEHPEWMDKSVSKTVEFRLSKNDDGGYKINSMTVMSESSST